MSITLAIGLLAFLVFGVFWIPFAVGTICYHASAGLALGNTPGAFLFGHRNATLTKGDTSSTPAARMYLEPTGEIEFVDAITRFEPGSDPNRFADEPLATRVH